MDSVSAGIAVVRDTLSSGVIGEVTKVKGTLSWKMPFDASNRFFLGNARWRRFP